MIVRRRSAATAPRHGSLSGPADHGRRRSSVSRRRVTHSQRADAVGIATEGRSGMEPDRGFFSQRRNSTKHARLRRALPKAAPPPTFSADWKNKNAERGLMGLWRTPYGRFATRVTRHSAFEPERRAKLAGCRWDRGFPGPYGLRGSSKLGEKKKSPADCGHWEGPWPAARRRHRREKRDARACPLWLFFALKIDEKPPR